MLIQGNKISYRYSSQSEYTLNNITFSLDYNSRVGLIGDNGAGKSTLLKVLVGELEPQGYLNSKVNIGVLSQEIKTDDTTVIEILYQNKKTLLKLREVINNFDGDDCTVFQNYEEAGGWVIEVEIEKWLSRFKLNEDFLFKDLQTLSGGEKTKVNLISMLLEIPDIIMMDEPTNHLDMETIKWLEEYLIHQKTPYIIISHDREFLDKTTTSTWEIENGSLEVFSGNYSFYKKKKDEKYSLELHLYQEQQKKINKLTKSLKDRKNWGLSHQAETRAEGFAPIYEELKNRAKDTMRNAKVLENRINLIIEKEEQKKPQIPEKARIVFQEQKGKAGKNCVTLEDVSKSYDKNLFKNLDLIIKHGERLAVTGLNGSGKTTLLKMINGSITDYEGRIFLPDSVKTSYYSQEYEDLNLDNTILDEVTGGELSNQSNIRRSLAGIGFKGDEVFRLVCELSPGEKCKLSLIKAMLSDSNLLILDEPTNHLEIKSREVVEDALLNYKGTTVFVSHDRRFIDKIVTSTLNLD